MINVEKLSSKIIQTTQQTIQKIQGKHEKITNAISLKKLDGLNAIANQNIIIVQKSEQITDAISKKLAQLKQIATNISCEKFIFQNGNTSNFIKYEGTQAGTNKGYWVKNIDENKLYYTKLGKNQDSIFALYYDGQIALDGYTSVPMPIEFNTNQSEVEVLSSKIYKILGLNVPEMKLIETQNGIGLISEFIPNLQPVNMPQKAINEGFGADIFLAN